MKDWWYFKVLNQNFVLSNFFDFSKIPISGTFSDILPHWLIPFWFPIISGIRANGPTTTGGTQFVTRRGYLSHLSPGFVSVRVKLAQIHLIILKRFYKSTWLCFRFGRGSNLAQSLTFKLKKMTWTPENDVNKTKYW